MLLDRVQHLFWHLQDFKHLSYRQNSERLEDGVLMAYRLLDRFVGEIISAIDQNTYVDLVSDHGFANKEQIFFTNKWLRREGRVQYKKVIKI